METIEKILLCDLGDKENYPSQEIVNLIEQAFHLLGTEDLTEVLFERSDSRDLQKIVDVLDIAAWCGNDNGTTAQITLEKWLMGDNSDKIWVSLHTECYPFKDAIKMVRVLSNVKSKFPEHAVRCEELIRNRLAKKITSSDAIA